MTATLLNGRYRIGAELGRGASGIVVRAEDTTLDRAVAVKLLDRATADSDSAERLAREARAAAALNHPHIVAVYDSGTDGGQAFFVMELVEGANLREVGALPLAQLIDVARQLCAALEHAHGHGIVHRDLKPENVLLARTAQGFDVKLADLGIALSRRATRITTEGTLLGTALYLSPEQALGPEVDGRADLYALGAVLYEQVAGRPPFTGDDPLAVISQHLHAPVVPPRTFRPDLPPGLEAIIVRLLAKAPGDRFASARETAEALAACTLEPAGEAAPAPEGGDRIAMLDQLARGRLVARRAELGQLRELWQRARQGRGHLALISGEPGVGKTRLAHELIVYAQLNGAVVLRGGSYEYEATTPYLPFVEALRGWVQAQDTATLREKLGASAVDLARFAPQIETRIGPLPAAPALGPHEERLRLFDSVARFFRMLASGEGLLLFLDDLHWADHGSLALLHYLLRNLRDVPWLVAATYREVELGRDHPLAASLVEWNRERLATRVSLGRFGAGDTAAMLATLFGQETVSADFSEVVHRETEGNPFFIEEVVKALIEQGQIYRDQGGWQRESAAELVIPQSIKAAVGRRLERLSAPCLEALHSAAALGKGFAFAELASATGMEEGALLDALDEATAAQLTRSTSGESFAFTHDKIREVLYEELNPIRRRRLHTKIGEALERLYATALDLHSQDLAHHFCEGGQLEKGYEYSVRAAECAVELFATDEALLHLLRAQECADALGDRAKIHAMDRRLADLYSLRGELPPSAAAYLRAIDSEGNADERDRLKVRLGEVYSRDGDPRGMELLQGMLETLDPQRQAFERAEALMLIGRYYHYRMEHHRSIECFEEARAVIEAHDDAAPLMLLYGYLAGAHQHLANFEESIAWARRCIVLGERHHNPIATAMGNEFLAEDYSAIGNWAETREYTNRNIEIGERTGSLERLAWTAFPLARAAYHTGDLAETIEESERGISLFERTGDRRGSVFPRTLLTWALLDCGRIEDARREAQRAFDDGEAVGQGVIRTQGHGALARLHVALGDWEAAVALGRACAERFAVTDNRIGLLQLSEWFTEPCILAGHTDEARRCIDEWLPLAERSKSIVWAMPLVRARGMLHAATGDPEAAERDFADAIARAEGNEMRLEAARTYRERAKLRSAVGDRAGARADAERAITLFEACGAVPEIAKARALLG